MANVTSIVETWTSQYFAELFLTPALVSDGLFAGGYNVDPFVNKSKTVYVGSELSGIVQKKTTCGFNPVGAFEMSEVQLVTQPMAINMEQCANTFYETVFKQELRKGSNIYDLGGTVIADAIVENYTRALKNDAFILAWFGNDSLASTNFLSPFDGWFTLADADSDVAKVTIGSTGNWALAALREAYESENGQLIRQTATPSIHVTPNVYYNLMATYENTGTDSGLQTLKDGGELTFRGIPVIEEKVWGSAISRYNLSNTKRIFFGVLENLHVGTDIANPGSDAKLFLDELTEKYYFKANFDLGVNYTHPELFVYGKG